MRKIAVINQKGGVGKTTTCCNVGAALTFAGRSVLLIDLDPQAHLTMHFGIEPDADKPSIYDVLTDRTPIEQAAVDVGENLRLVPSHIDLAAAEMELVSVVGREVILREAIQALDRQYDFILVDCPPSLGVLTINGLVAMSEVLIPMQAHFLALQGMGKLLESVRLIKARINPELAVTGVIFCMYESGTRLAAEVAGDLGAFLESSRGNGDPWSEARLFDTVIRRNVKLAECPSHGQTIFDYAPRCNGVQDYAALAAELLGVESIDVPSVVRETAVHRPEPAESEEIEATIDEPAAAVDSAEPSDVPFEPATSAPDEPENAQAEEESPIQSEGPAEAETNATAPARRDLTQEERPTIISIEYEDDQSELTPAHEGHGG